MITYEKVQQLATNRVANTAVKLLLPHSIKLLHNHVNICHGNQDASKKAGQRGNTWVP